jgi:hypothetical protein
MGKQHKTKHHPIVKRIWAERSFQAQKELEPLLQRIKDDRSRDSGQGVQRHAEDRATGSPR